MEIGHKNFYTMLRDDVQKSVVMPMHVVTVNECERQLRSQLRAQLQHIRTLEGLESGLFFALPGMRIKSGPGELHL